MSLCEKIPLKNSYLNTLNSIKDIHDLEFLVFLTVHSYLMNFNYANLTVHNLVHKKSKCVGISGLSLTVYEKKVFNCFYFDKAQSQCNDNMENTEFLNFSQL